MRWDDLASSGALLTEEAAPEESLRRLEAFLSALAALPKKTWRPRIDGRQIRIEGPGLERTRRLLEILEVPAPGREIVHIAGTSGKGSTAMMMAGALRAAGRRTAVFFSPHVTSLLERFWIDGRLIEPALGRRCAGKLAAAAAGMAEDPEIGPPSYFEATMALLLLAAEETDCETILLEAGLGGSYDATNAVGPARLDVITPIGLDHTDLLGDTVAKIARDKAGIITVGGVVISAAEEPEARREIEAAAAEKCAALYAPPQVEWKEGGMFDLRFADGGLWADFSLKMEGAHQAGNAALAAGACRLLGLDADAARAGVAAARLPARLEWMPGTPRVLLDGAHNRDKARGLADYLGKTGIRRFLFVVGTIGDKDQEGLAQEMAPLGDRFYVTLPPGTAPRPGTPPAVLAEALRRAGAARIETHLDPWAALDAALDAAGPEDAVVVTGSLYLAGELRHRWVSETEMIAQGTAFPGGLG